MKRKAADKLYGKSNSGKGIAISKIDLQERAVDWEYVNHAVTIFGWGETKDGEKFWRVRNSYGRGWGDRGNFLVRRGVDEFNIESGTNTFDVALCKKGQGPVCVIE